MSTKSIDVFNKIMGATPTKIKEDLAIFKAAWLDTALGPMIAIADDQGLYLLEFADRRGLEREVERLRIRKKAAIIPGTNKIIDSLQNELHSYFSGNLQSFNTPICIIGSAFQQKVWQELQKIPYGETRSYLQQAGLVGNTKAVRAVANANGANQLAIIIPCHRIINNNGALGGYGGGFMRKKWLIEHEKTHINNF